MARPNRQGVDYFPLDIHLDDKFKFIEIKHGLEGFATIIKLMQKIYSYGYWYQWGEDEALIFSHENSIEEELLQEIICEAVKRDIFNEAMYDNYNILTSTGIQKRYQQIIKRRKNVEVVTEYLLIGGKFGENEHTDISLCGHDADIMDTESEHNVGKSTQSKVKESKVKERKGIDYKPTFIKDIKEAEEQAHKENEKKRNNYKPIVEYLNLKAGKQYRPSTKATQSKIDARMNDGFTIDDFKKVIDIKVKEWKDDSEMEKFIRPETLFGNKFEGYLNQKSNKADSENPYKYMDSTIGGATYEGRTGKVKKESSELTTAERTGVTIL